MSGEYAVNVHVFTEDPEHVARAAEILGRAVAGLALEGITASLRVGPFDMDDEETP